MTNFTTDTTTSCYSNLCALMNSFANKDLTGKKITINFSEEIEDEKYNSKCWEVTFGSNDRKVTVMQTTSIATGRVIRETAFIDDSQNELFGCEWCEDTAIVVYEAYKQLKSLHNRCEDLVLFEDVEMLNLRFKRICSGYYKASYNNHVIEVCRVEDVKEMAWYFSINGSDAEDWSLTKKDAIYYASCELYRIVNNMLTAD